MRCLITGAAGFLGRHFTTHHVEAGDDVVAVDNFSSGRAQWAPGRYEKSYLDAAQFFAHEGSTYDLAYHFAAPVGGREKIEGDPLYNADSLRLDAAFFRWAHGKVGTAIYPSSSAVYGIDLQEGAGTALREVAFDPGQRMWLAPDEMYGFTKMAGEVLAAKAARYGLRTLVLRPFSGYGEGQPMDYPVPAICHRALLRQNPLVVWGSGYQSRDFVHVSDIVGATQAALDKVPESGVLALNIGSGVPITFVEIAKMAARIVGYDPRIETDASKPEGVHARYADIRRLSRIYTPQVSLPEGLARVIKSLSAEEIRQ